MAEIKTGPDPARLPWIGSEPDAARGGVRNYAAWIAALIIVAVGVGFFFLGSRGETPAPQQQAQTTTPVESTPPAAPVPAARTQKPSTTATASQRKPAPTVAQHQRTRVATAAPAKVAPPAAKARPSHVAAKTEPKTAPAQVAAKAEPKTAPAQVATTTETKTTKVASAATTKGEPKAAPRPIRTRVASATRPEPLPRRRVAATGPILAMPDPRPPERFGGIAQVGAFTDKRQADLIWRDMVHANAGLEDARVSLIQNRDWNGQLFYQFQIATASPQDSEILCRSMRQINLRCEVVSFP